MIIKNSEKWEHHSCPNCDADISQEEIDVSHCNNCNEDIDNTKTFRGITLLNIVMTPEEKEFLIKNGLQIPES